MNFKSSAKVLFLDPLSEKKLEYEKGSKLALILSPSLYWVKKIKLPVSSVREAKKLLESVFEETLPESIYSYTTYKQDDMFVVFAYEDKKIVDLLTEQGLSISNIASIHFAQSEFDTIESQIKINDSQVMQSRDGVVIITPLSWSSDAQDLDLEKVKVSKHKIQLQQYGHIVDNKSLYKIGAISVVFAVILIVEIFITTSKTDKILEAKDKIFSKYKLQSTMFQNRSTQSKYGGIYKTQTKLRSYMSYFLNLRLKTNQKISLVDYKNKILTITIAGVTKANAKSITSQLDSKKLKYKTHFSGENMRVEMKL